MNDQTNSEFRRFLRGEIRVLGLDLWQMGAVLLAMAAMVAVNFVLFSPDVAAKPSKIYVVAMALVLVAEIFAISCLLRLLKLRQPLVQAGIILWLLLEIDLLVYSYCILNLRSIGSATLPICALIGGQFALGIVWLVMGTRNIVLRALLTVPPAIALRFIWQAAFSGNLWWRYENHWSMLLTLGMATTCLMLLIGRFFGFRLAAIRHRAISDEPANNDEPNSPLPDSSLPGQFQMQHVMGMVTVFCVFVGIGRAAGVFNTRFFTSQIRDADMLPAQLNYLSQMSIATSLIVALCLWAVLAKGRAWLRVGLPVLVSLAWGFGYWTWVEQKVATVKLRRGALTGTERFYYYSSGSVEEGWMLWFALFSLMLMACLAILHAMGFQLVRRSRRG